MIELGLFETKSLKKEKALKTKSLKKRQTRLQKVGFFVLVQIEK